MDQHQPRPGPELRNPIDQFPLSGVGGKSSQGFYLRLYSIFIAE